MHLGPVAFVRGKADAATVNRAFARFRPAEVLVDVHMPSEPGVVLAGTLRLPAHPPRTPMSLAADGIAALEYDKRGIGQATGKYQENLDRLTADATVAVAAMRGRPEIDADRIALIGHSQGSVIAPAVAAADPLRHLGDHKPRQIRAKPCNQTPRNDAACGQHVR